MKASVLITVYNCWPVALKAIDAHLKYGGDLIEEIVVVDDCSNPDSVPTTLPDKVRLIRNEVNKGYVKSVNVGFKAITSDLIILFDADSIPLNFYGDKLPTYFESDASIGAIGFSTVNNNGAKTGMTEPLPNAWSVILGQQLYAKVEPWFKQNPYVIYSCALVVRREAMLSINGFDEDFDFLEADTDFSMRLIKAGWKLQMSPELISNHQGWGSPQAQSKRVLRFYVNRHRLLVKHDLWKSKMLFKALVLTRLYVEQMLLKIMGRFLFKDSAVLADKQLSRSQVLLYVKEKY